MLNEWEASLLTVGTFDTIEGFCRHVNNIRMPSAIAKHANYHLFKDGIRPVSSGPYLWPCETFADRQRSRCGRTQPTRTAASGWPSSARHLV